MGKKAALHNLGCKVNAYETETMRQLLEEAGYEIVPFAPGADVYVINTCTVTNIADRKSRQMLHKARKMNPDAIVVATGCYVQTAETPLEEDRTIDLVLGNNCKKDLVAALRMFEAEREQDASFSKENDAYLESAVDEKKSDSCMEEMPEIRMEPIQKTMNESMWDGKASEETLQYEKPLKKKETSGEAALTGGIIDINHTKEYESLSITRTEEHTRAYIKVQDGCNQFCTYCIIPYARGRVRSRQMSDVLQEVGTLAENGCREVVLTGIHLSSYGTDLGTSLLSLIQAVHAIPGIARIRLGSLEPGIITEEFAQALRALPKVCPHFHLSLQSGCTSVLKRMNRRYTAEEFEKKCEILRAVFDQPAITTDVIVGFPQETEEEFQTTVSFLEKLGLYETHIFKHSRRQGTRAAAMAGQIPEQEKTIRSNQLIKLGEKNRDNFEKKYASRPVEVLFEEKEFLNGNEYYVGYTKEYIRVGIPASEDYSNRILFGKMGKMIVPHVFFLEKD